jgi:hypothetical protein
MNVSCLLSFIPKGYIDVRKCQDFAPAHRFLWLQRWSRCGSVDLLAAPACKCPSPSLLSVESPLHRPLSHYSARPPDRTMFHASCKATGLSTTRRRLLYYRYFSEPFSRQFDDYFATDAYEPDRRWPYGRLGYFMKPCIIHKLFLLRLAGLDLAP